jgi:hypothetical protein
MSVAKQGEYVMKVPSKQKLFQQGPLDQGRLERNYRETGPFGEIRLPLPVHACNTCLSRG